MSEEWNNDLKQRAAKAKEADRIAKVQVRYGEMDRETLVQLISPKWTFDSEGLSYNLKVRDFFPNGFTLLEAPDDSILGMLATMNQYDQDKLFPEERHPDRIACVMNQWERGQCLTPPIFTVYEGKIAVCDGMHRLSACTFLKGNPVPFYVKREEEAWFARLAGATVLKQGDWP